MSEPVRFLLNGERVDVAGRSPQTTLLEFLRDDRHLTGTKEGCAEGDCGACTVVIAERSSTGLAWKPINACIRLLPSLDGKAVYTVESLKSANGELHPVQQALVDCHASQCGFCTPGFAMSLFGLYKTQRQPSRRAIDDALSGNLCRCTGYRPIVDAARRMYAMPAVAGWRSCGVTDDGQPLVSADERELADRLAALERAAATEYAHGGHRWIAPKTIDELAAARAQHPSARIVAGMTDIALEATKQHRVLADMIYIGNVDALAAVREGPAFTEIGAAVTLADAADALNRAWPELDEAWQRFASVPIRNSGTLAGNVANGSPIGDSMPALIALGASVVIRGRQGERTIDVDAFYPAFRQTALAPGEFITAVRVPKRPPALSLCAYKISKRFDQDISAVFACFALIVEAGRIRRARIGCGGVAPTPARAHATERALEGAAWTVETAERAASVLSREFTPIDDMRASAGYRRTVLGNLLLRCFHATSGTLRAPLRVESPLVTAPAR